jgi:Na+-translocating ferredoxin:NAD+ oxidoreductase subunit C
MFRLIKAHWPHPETPGEPVYLGPPNMMWPPEAAPEPLRQPEQSYPEFLDAIGAVGMGGSMFPAARKLAASEGVSTVVINAVECEPGTTIDKALLLHHAPLIQAGVEASAAACGATRIVIAIARSRKLSALLRERYPFDVIMMPRGYPGGAERLIVKKLTGKMLPAGAYPGRVGVLVQNVATLRAVGRALVDSIPLVERPLTVAAPHRCLHHDVIVPIGMTVGALLEVCEVVWNPEDETLIAGGLMMGRAVQPETEITKGTTSIMLMPNSALATCETNCINCGACNVACPLGLHPIGMVNPVREGKYPLPPAVATQLEECFLCGACAAVCPARILLVKYIKEGKACLLDP